MTDRTQHYPSRNCCILFLRRLVILSRVTLRNTIVLQKLTVPQLVQKFLAFYGCQRFIASFISPRHVSLSRARFSQSTPSILYFFNIDSNIIFPSTLRSWQWSLYFRWLRGSSVRTYFVQSESSCLFPPTLCTCFVQ